MGKHTFCYYEAAFIERELKKFQGLKSMFLSQEKNENIDKGKEDEDDEKKSSLIIRLSQLH